MSLRTRVESIARSGWAGIKVGRDELIRQANLLVDRPRWASSLTWRDKVSAVSWPRASVVAGLSLLTVGSFVWILLPHGIQAHPPRLPTEQEWRANQSAAKAMEAELSPALANANRSEAPRRP